MTKTTSYEVETIISLIEDQLMIVDRQITNGEIAGPLEDGVTRSTILLKSLPEIVNDLLTDLNIK